MCLIEQETPYPHWEVGEPVSLDLLWVVPECGGLPDSRLHLPQSAFNLGHHGFARQLPWHPEVQALARGALEISAMVDNRGNDTIPFSFGLHPCFNLSSLEGVRFEGLPARRLDHLTIEDASTTGQRPDRSRSWPAASTCWCGPELPPRSD